jgi:hypothetical protein
VRKARCGLTAEGDVTVILALPLFIAVTTQQSLLLQAIAGKLRLHLSIYK